MGIAHETWTTVFYYPRSFREADGTLVMQTSSYSEEGSHAIGFATIQSLDADFEFWLWFIPFVSSRERAFISRDDLEVLRPEFELACSEATSATEFRQLLLEAVPIRPKLTFREWISNATFSCMDAAFMTVLMVLVYTVNTISWCRSGFRRREK